jgi:hypothetical protein
MKNTIWYIINQQKKSHTMQFLIRKKSLSKHVSYEGTKAPFTLELENPMTVKPILH